MSLNQIELYEKQSGKKVNQIAFYQDKNTQYTYSDIMVSGDINIRALSKDWVTRAITNYYSGKWLELTEINKNIQQNFNEKDWEQYNEKQISILEANDVIDNNESPTMAIKTKKDSSLVRAFDMAKEDEDVITIALFGTDFTENEQYGNLYGAADATMILGIDTKNNMYAHHDKYQFQIFLLIL